MDKTKKEEIEKEKISLKVQETEFTKQVLTPTPPLVSPKEETSSEDDDEEEVSDSPVTEPSSSHVPYVWTPAKGKTAQDISAWWTSSEDDDDYDNECLDDRDRRAFLAAPAESTTFTPEPDSADEQEYLGSEMDDDDNYDKFKKNRNWK